MSCFSGSIWVGFGPLFGGFTFRGKHFVPCARGARVGPRAVCLFLTISVAQLGSRQATPTRATLCVKNKHTAQRFVLVGWGAQAAAAARGRLLV